MINILEKKDCTGCYGCANVCPKNCINMIEDDEGFKYPKINNDICIKCNLCDKVCPILNNRNMDNNPIALAAYNKDERIRKESSSGGVFTLIAESIIKSGGIVFGAKFNNEFEVVHDYTDNIYGIAQFRGAKYVQSNIGETYSLAKMFLEKGRKVLFSGTPCQIGGLKRYLQKEHENLICVDLICHGVPSPISWRKYKQRFEKNNNIKGINFRDKTYGWKSYSFKVEFEDSSDILIKRNENSYMDGFIGDIYLRPSCHNCKFKSINRESDITLADFWGIENVRRDMNDDKGISLILINSEKGKKNFRNISDSIEKAEVDIDEAIKYNSSAIKSSYCNPRRDYFFKRINKTPFDKLVIKSLKDPLSIRLKIKIYNMIKRVR
ncbi:Coenzyme F420 hydrogenase/dehydrogenase, beta subunit C-terminal domain [Clostridium celatum]|uniref:4Fe-4S binding domain protein n=1 Tax=Clostridium celatum DSM 1785 TaxID=545697 RepID=L1QN66_9CLOT|nr:Coenzyme F420 hydrogenase/dehydrogenase, beta subunit C-terminal domain [Clostridium celatum]EKY29012.1 4Fe-4S binding domain protein [Clostridium celatum DSM 1785]MCE9654426.1 Coenzyme F420 hydrogenase/dehydrogenase, beta subunit C-terminal domain [Clostridium celatum]